MMTRTEHLAWAKARALEYIDVGDTKNAISSMLSDLNKHDETRPGQSLVSLTMQMLLAGYFDDPIRCRDHINGFN